MRVVTKNICLKVGEETREFRITKLDAFSGARLLKLLSHADSDNLQNIVMNLPDDQLELLMKTCLRHAEALLPAGPVRIWNGDGWGLPELEHDGWTCLKLTMEVISWTLEGFFPGSGSPS